MNTFTKDGRKFVQSRNGKVYSYGMMVATMVVTFVATALLLMLGFVLLFGEGEGLSFAFWKSKFVGLVVVYVSYRLGKVLYNIIMKF